MAAVVEVGGVGQQIGDAAERRLLTDRQLERRDARAESVAQLLERALEARPFAVELVDEHHAGHAELRGDLPRRIRLDLDAFDRADHEDGQVGHAQRRVDVADEVRVPGAVDEVDLVVLPLERRERERQGQPALLLLGVEVGDRRSVLDPADPSDGAGAVQQRLGQGRLARSAVAHQGDVSDLLRRKALQVVGPPK